MPRRLRAPVAASLVALSLVAFVLLADVGRALAGVVASEGDARLDSVATAYHGRLSVAMAPDGRSVVAWSGGGPGGAECVFARRFAADGTPLGPELQVNATTVRAHRSPSVAIAPDGRFVVAWHSTNPDYGAYEYDINARLYGADGNPRGDDFRVNVTNGSVGGYVTAAIADDGQIVITWMSDAADRVTWGVYARVFAADGTPRTGELRVGTGQTWEMWPAIAMAADGRFVVTWSRSMETGDWDIYARRYGADGTPRSDPHRVTTTTELDQLESTVAMERDGRYVIAWTSRQRGGSRDDVNAQRFDADGNRRGGEFRVNSEIGGLQGRPAAAMGADGRFVITWQSEGQDGSGWGVYGQRFDPDGLPRGGEFRANAATVNDQVNPAVAMGADGRFVVAFLGQDASGSAGGVYARRYLVTAPTARADTYALSGPSLDVPAPGVLANDSDSAGTHLRARLVSPPTGGAVTLRPDGSFTYTPSERYAGSDRFTYRARGDLDAESDTTVTIAGIATACLPRPSIRTTPASSGGRLFVTINATPMNGEQPNRVHRLLFSRLDNTRVTMNGHAIAANQAVDVPVGTAAPTFVLERAAAGQAATVHFTVVDGCGEWKTFVGGGPTAF